MGTVSLAANSVTFATAQVSLHFLKKVEEEFAKEVGEMEQLTKFLEMNKQKVKKHWDAYKNRKKAVTTARDMQVAAQDVQLAAQDMQLAAQEIELEKLRKKDAAQKELALIARQIASHGATAELLAQLAKATSSLDK